MAINAVAYAYLHGMFDYNAMPLALTVCAVQFHVKPNNGKHGVRIQRTGGTFRHHWNIINVMKFVSNQQG